MSIPRLIKLPSGSVISLNNIREIGPIQHIGWRPRIDPDTYDKNEQCFYITMTGGPGIDHQVIESMCKNDEFIDIQTCRETIISLWGSLESGYFISLIERVDSLEKELESRTEQLSDDIKVMVNRIVSLKQDFDQIKKEWHDWNE